MRTFARKKLICIICSIKNSTKKVVISQNLFLVYFDQLSRIWVFQFLWETIRNLFWCFKHLLHLFYFDFFEILIFINASSWNKKNNIYFAITSRLYFELWAIIYQPLFTIITIPALYIILTLLLELSQPLSIQNILLLKLL